MSYDTLGMIRRGWQDGVATVAPHVPGLADLVEQRLDEAIRLGRLDEAGLLSIVDAATQLAADMGAVDVAPALSKRLRRHVYEYLLSLDALSSTEANAAAMKESEQATGLAEMPLAEVGASIPESNGGGPHRFPPIYPVPEPDQPLSEPGYPDPESTYAEPEPTYPEPDFGYPQAETPYPLPEASYPLPDAVYPQPEEAGTSGAGEEGSGASLPQFRFHIGDPDDLLTDRAPQPEQASVPEPAEPHRANAVEAPAEVRAPQSRRASFADPSTWPKPVTPTLRGSRDPLAEGLRDEPLSPDDLPVSSAPDGTRFQDVGPWPAAPAADPPHRSGPPDIARWSSPWPASEKPPVGVREVPVTGASPAPGIADFEPATGSAPQDGREDWRNATTGWLPVSPPNGGGAAPPEIAAGWSVRQPEAVELHMTPVADSPAPVAAPPTNDIPERDLVALRSSVNERLRKKRCDDAAAVLQQAAQELGGQAVAELALDAGDRCRSLGKRNAALNCYLAASRADPVYEPPLARLADICIDDQDIDLAVSYLERIARLTRLRGDNHGALRIYRKIATIAPYRDDVLEMLMRAQTTGRMDP
ncbi:MAG: hypothetical protein ABSE52_01720 [Candidatus Dormibacteria bacterium]|jgi:hypothetical protein